MLQSDGRRNDLSTANVLRMEQCQSRVYARFCWRQRRLHRCCCSVHPWVLCAIAAAAIAAAALAAAAGPATTLSSAAATRGLLRDPTCMLHLQRVRGVL